MGSEGGPGRLEEEGGDAADEGKGGGGGDVTPLALGIGIFGGGGGCVDPPRGGLVAIDEDGAEDATAAAWSFFNLAIRISSIKLIGGPPPPRGFASAPAPNAPDPPGVNPFAGPLLAAVVGFARRNADVGSGIGPEVGFFLKLRIDASRSALPPSPPPPLAPAPPDGIVILGGEARLEPPPPASMGGGGDKVEPPAFIMGGGGGKLDPPIFIEGGGGREDPLPPMVEGGGGGRSMEGGGGGSDMLHTPDHLKPCRTINIGIRWAG